MLFSGTSKIFLYLFQSLLPQQPVTNGRKQRIDLATGGSDLQGASTEAFYPA
jgi:hypothetical protein